MKETIKEFKDFAIKGNAFDLAVGVVIGAAFGSVVSSIVEDIINPLIGWLTGGIDFSDKTATLVPSIGEIPALTLNYGLFVTAVINFIIVAFAIFMIVKQVNKLKRKEAEAPKEAPKPSNQEVLLAEIRDLLKK